jgi:hypothetical protein
MRPVIIEAVMEPWRESEPGLFHRPMRPVIIEALGMRSNTS